MTLLQLKVVESISRTGSISAAAKELSISQPNASKYLKQLEEELGFKVFSREGKKLNITDKGNDFLFHARKIIEENKKIYGLKDAEHVFKLRAGSMNYTIPILAFRRLCEEQNDSSGAELQFLNATAEGGLKLIRDNKLDLFITVTVEESSEKVIRLCQKFDLTRIEICKVPGVVNISRNHPLVSEIGDGSIRLDMFKDYPYVDYRSYEQAVGLFNVDIDNYFDYKGKFTVDERDTRLSLISNTNAFGLGVQLRKEILDKYNLMSYPIPGAFLDVCVVVRRGELDTMEIKRYIEIFKEEMMVE